MCVTVPFDVVCVGCALALGLSIINRYANTPDQAAGCLRFRVEENPDPKIAMKNVREAHLIGLVFQLSALCCSHHPDFLRNEVQSVVYETENAENKEIHRWISDLVD